MTLILKTILLVSLFVLPTTVDAATPRSTVGAAQLENSEFGLVTRNESKEIRILNDQNWDAGVAVFVAQLESGGVIFFDDDEEVVPNLIDDPTPVDPPDDPGLIGCDDNQITADIKSITDDGNARLSATTGIKAQAQISLEVLLAVRDYYATAEIQCDRPEFRSAIEQIELQIVVLRDRINSL